MRQNGDTLIHKFGDIVQLAERMAVNHDVIGSSPIIPVIPLYHVNSINLLLTNAIVCDII